MASEYRAARAWDDLRIEPVARTAGTNAPAFEKWFDDGGLAIVTASGTTRGVWVYSFDDAVVASEKEINFTLQLSHEWDQGQFEIHVHWTPSHSQNNATPRWGLEYTWIQPGSVFGATAAIAYATGNVQGAANLVAATHYITELIVLTPGASTSGVSTILIGRLFRNSSNAADTYTTAGNKCGLLYIDAHIVKNSNGSITEYTK